MPDLFESSPQGRRRENSSLGQDDKYGSSDSASSMRQDSVINELRSTHKIASRQNEKNEKRKEMGRRAESSAVPESKSESDPMSRRARTTRGIISERDGHANLSNLAHGWGSESETETETGTTRYHDHVVVIVQALDLY